MENMEPKTDSKKTVQDNPEYFGTYLNMARHNIFLINNELAKRFDINSILTTDENIGASFMTHKTVFGKTNVNLLFTNLTRYLPIAKIFSSDLLPKQSQVEIEASFQGVDVSNMTHFFKLCFEELNSFRDEYSHYYSIKSKTSKKTKINPVFAPFFKECFAFAIDFVKSRFESVLDQKDFDLVNKIEVIDANNTISDRGIVFLACLFLDKENAFQFMNKVVGFKATNTNSFLATREVFSVFCVTLPHDKFLSDNPKQALQLDMLNYLNRCPKELFNALSPNSKKQFQPNLSAIANLNIEENSINESVDFENYQNYIENISTKKRSADRFPYFALKHLSENNNFDFDFQINLGKVLKKSYKKVVLGVQPDQNNRNIVENILVFNKMALFENKNEDEIFEIKKSISNETQFIKKFSTTTISDFEQFAPHFNIENNKIGILPQNNKMFFNQLFRPIVPTAFLSTHELPKIVLLEHLEKGSSSQIIKTFIDANTNVIFNKALIEEIKETLAFEKTLYKVFFDEKLKVINWKTDIETQLSNLNESINKLKETQAITFDEKRNKENTLKNKLSERNSLKYALYVKRLNDRKNTLNKVLEKYNLNASQIPSNTIDYWLKIEAVKDETTIKNKIRAQKSECRDRIKECNNGNYPKIGEMATFLARDIVRLVIDKEVKMKITSFYYDLLQQCLALFEDKDKKQLFIDLCGKELQLFDNQKGHPFLSNINLQDIHRTKDLYQKYIEEKGTKTIPDKFYNRKSDKWEVKQIEANWMNKTFYHKVKNIQTGKDETLITIPTNKAMPMVYRKLLDKTTDFDKWFTNVTSGCVTLEDPKPNPKPIDLPTNLFDDKLIKLLKEKIGIDNSDTTVYNFSKLLEIQLNDAQPFYDNDREYIIFKNKPYQAIVPIKLGTKKTFKDYYREFVEPTFRLKKQDSKQLQKNQVEAVFKNAISENEKIIRHYKTKDRIMLLMLKETLEADRDIKLSEIYPKSETNPLNKQILIKQQIGNKIITVTRKRKEYSFLKRFLSDRRLPALLTYFCSDEIPFETLKQELNDYQTSRLNIVEAVFRLEKTILNIISDQDFKDLEKTANDRITHIQFKHYTNWLLKYKMIDKQQQVFLDTVRNKLLHNEFPDQDIIAQTMQLDQNSSFSNQIANQYLAIIENIITNKLKI